MYNMLTYSHANCGLDQQSAREQFQFAGEDLFFMCTNVKIIAFPRYSVLESVHISKTFELRIFLNNKLPTFLGQQHTDLPKPLGSF
jgi:hypothetical protein